MDNLSSHKKPAVRVAIRGAGARLLFLPPYSPDLNPIEQVFAKLKHLLRKAAERSHEHTWRRIDSLLDAFPSNECAAYLVNSGYAATSCHPALGQWGFPECLSPIAARRGASSRVRLVRVEAKNG